MHNTVTTVHTGGISLELFHCSHDLVRNWGNPVLRSTFWRLYLATSRGATLQSTSRQWALLPNTVCLIPPDSPLRGKSLGPFSLYYAHFNCSIQLHDSTPLFMSSPASIESRLRDALEQGAEHLFRSVMLELTANAISNIPPSLIRAPIADSRIEKAYRLMKENMDSRLSNQQLARQLHISEASLLRLFRANAGTSPQKEHLRMRLNQAAEMLRNSEESIEHIANICGFWDRNHFTRVFTKEWRVPPGQYRRSASEV